MTTTPAAPPELPSQSAAGAEHVALAQTVHALRKARGLSQEQLAELAGCNRLSILRLEKARYSPSFARIVHLAAAFGLTLHDLFASVDERLPAARKETQQ